MNDLFHNFHFLRPWLLVFLLLPLLLFFKKLKTGGNASSWADVCDKIFFWSAIADKGIFP